MRSAPPTIDGARVLLVADLSNATVTGDTRHVVDGSEIEDFATLAIVQYGGDEGVYLLYCDDDWRTVTDTHHDSVAEAVSQAEFEFESVEFRAPELGKSP